MCSSRNSSDPPLALGRSQSLDYSAGDDASASSSDGFLPADHPNFRSLPPIPEYEYFSGEGEGDPLSQASHSDLAFEWSMLCQECPDCWTRTDLQLAAELGKTLLEKNKDLETSLKRQQIIIDDQAQEIEYLSKQQFAYREASDRQVKIYEQLEESISDLEKANKKLVEENNNDKQHIKSLMSTVDCLESRCEELQRQLDQIRSEELHSLESSANDSNQGQSLTKPLGRRRKDRRKSSSIVECLLSSEKWKRTDSEFHLILPTFIRRSSEDDPHGSHSSDDPNPSSLTHSESNGDEDDEDESHDRLGEEISTGDLFEFFQPPSSSGYSSSSIDSHHHSEHSDNDNSEQTLTTTLAKELKAATTPALSEQHSSLPTTDLSSMELHHDLQLISELNLLRAKYDEVLERAKELEIIISKLQVENEALKTSEQEGEPPGSGLSHEDLNGIEHDGLFESHVAGNVREEVDNVEVVRSGKMCGNCLGPMDEHPPGELLAQAAKQVAMTIQSELVVLRGLIWASLVRDSSYPVSGMGRWNGCERVPIRSRDHLWLDLWTLAIFVLATFLMLFEVLGDWVTACR
eukprot:maker-scaffold1080_size63862-snap-gene-0.13 protein:Tk03555 transcript:maker-scaffold1080_size63862-snap-gene-0.13-mRNA-1 annotation:"cerebellar degeneration-related protein 2-like isoform x2"